MNGYMSIHFKIFHEHLSYDYFDVFILYIFCFVIYVFSF